MGVSAAQQEASTFLVYQAEHLIDERYGPFSNHYRPYHNSLHAVSVAHAAYDIAKLAVDRGKLPEVAPYLALDAGAYHDYEQGEGAGKNELMSAVKCMADMRGTGAFHERYVRWTGRAILGTQVRFDQYGVLHQAANPNDYLSQVVADADLSNLGLPSDEYLDWTLRLYQERHPGEPLEGSALDHFADEQIRLLTTHTFYTEEAAELFPNQIENLICTENLVRRLKQA